MKQKRSLFLLIVLIIVSLGIATYFYIYRPDLGPLDPTRVEYILVDNYKIYYNSLIWKLESDPSKGTTLTNQQGVTINLVTSKVQFNSLDDVLNDRLKELNSDIFDIYQSDITVSGIKFKSLQIKPKNAENSTAENTYAYAALLKDNVYFVGMIFYREGSNIEDAKGIITGIRNY